MSTYIQRAMASLAVVLVGIASTSSMFAQSTTTLQAIRIERPTQTGVYITLSPPTSALPVGGYTLTWPATAPTNGQVLGVTGTGPYQLAWSSAVTSTLELAATSTGGLRRVATITSGGLLGNVGSYANDFQGSRTSASQTASGDYSLVGGGQNNTASGSYSVVLGGNTNTATGARSLVGAGENNNATGTGSMILGGSANNNAGQNGVIGGGETNTMSSTATNGFLGGGSNNVVSGANAVVGGGNNNQATGYASGVVGGNDNRATDSAAFVGGGSGNRANGPYSAIAGGQSNTTTSAARMSFIGGGTSNTASGVMSVIGGGNANTAAGLGSVVGGGESNSNSGQYGFIGSGQSNSISSGSTNSLIGGGASNTVTSASNATIGGGQSNTVAADYATIPGGRNMTLASGATGSFGFNGGGSNISVSTAQTFVIANANLWIGNNDNTVRELRFYEAYNTTGSYPGGSTNYVAFKAPNSTNSNTDNTYTLPDRIGSSRQVLRIATGPSSTAGTLEWAAPANMINPGTVDVTADNQALTTTQMDYMTFVRLRGDGNPANRTVTLPNGATDGIQLVLKAVANGNAAYGVELVDGLTDNLLLKGNFQMGDNDTITLVWDNTSSLWMELSRSDN